MGRDEAQCDRANLDGTLAYHLAHGLGPPYFSTRHCTYQLQGIPCHIHKDGLTIRIMVRLDSDVRCLGGD